MNRSHFPPIATRTRLAEKQRELAHFVELQNMSAELVAELELLETRLGNLATGTEKVAVVLQNWGNIARALTLASCKFIYYTPAKFFFFFFSIYFRLYWLIFCVCVLTFYFGQLTLQIFVKKTTRTGPTRRCQRPLCGFGLMTRTMSLLATRVLKKASMRHSSNEDTNRNRTNKKITY